MLEIRRAESSGDFDTFRNLIIEYEESLPDDLRHSNLKGELQNLPHAYGPPNAALLASVDDRAAGCVALVDLDASSAIIKKLYVKPEYRQFGVAHALLASLMTTAREQRRTRLVLDTHRTRLLAAYKLYLSLGFTECAPYGEVEYASPTFMELYLA